jgi:hypothetical protein
LKIILDRKQQMKLNLGQVPVNGSVNFSTSFSASKNAEGVLTINLSQSQNKNLTSGESSGSNTSVPVQGTEAEVKARLAELGLAGLVE